MRIAYVVPTNSYAFFREIIPYLESHGHSLVVNPQHLSRFDCLWAAILPQTPTAAKSVLESSLPKIIWHWDQYAFVNFDEPGWKELLLCMPGALDIWSSSYETARLLRSIHGYDSFVVSSWVNPVDLHPPYYSGDFVFCAAGKDHFHKRVDWISKACTLLKLPFQNTYQGPNGMTRDTYCKVMRSCRCYVMAAFDEPNGTIPPLEAAACGKPVILSDLPGCREKFGPTAAYFNVWDFQDLFDKVNHVYHHGSQHTEAARERILKWYSVETVADRIAGRLKELEARL